MTDEPETRNARCPNCGGRHLDRIDLIEQTVYRRIEEIQDTDSIYGLRAVSRLPDRKGPTGRSGIGIRCADCGWRQHGRAGDRDQNPEHQELLRSLTGHGQ